MDDNSLAHSRYNCTYHIVFIPKYRRKAIFGALRKEVGEILGKICKTEDVTIVSNDARSCAHVRINTTQAEYIKNDRKNQGKKCTDAL